MALMVMMRDTCGTWMESSGLWSQTSLETVLGLSIVTSLHTVHMMIVMMRMIQIIPKTGSKKSRAQTQFLLLKEKYSNFTSHDISIILMLTCSPLRHHCTAPRPLRTPPASPPCTPPSQPA